QQRQHVRRQLFQHAGVKAGEEAVFVQRQVAGSRRRQAVEQPHLVAGELRGYGGIDDVERLGRRTAAQRQQVARGLRRRAGQRGLFGQRVPRVGQRRRDLRHGQHVVREVVIDGGVERGEECRVIFVKEGDGLTAQAADERAGEVDIAARQRQRVDAAL